MDQHRLDRLLTLLHRSDFGGSVLQRICVVCVDVTSMAGAGISRMLDGRHDALVASDPTAADVEMLQVRFSEGPCMDVVESFRPWFEPDLAKPEAARRWPSFAPAAIERGIAAAFAFPLMTGGVAIGALDIYAAEPGDMQREQVEDTLILAALAGLAVEGLDRAPSVTGVELSAEPAEEWAHAAIVHNASGMVSEQLAISLDDALLRLRAVAFATDRRVADVSRDVVERTLRLDRWGDDG